MTIAGLTNEEVQQRKAAGLANTTKLKVSRSYTDIIIKNVFTTFNILLFIVGAALLILEEPTNAISATIFIILNIIVATTQEVRAKRKLDKIALLLSPKAKALRDGKIVEIDQNDIVMDDVLVLSPGDQILVDGVLVESKFLEIDESLLTGESTSIRRREGDQVYSGAFCITGEGLYKVTAFGKDTYAYKMLESARKYKNKYTPLQLETSSVIKLHIATCFIFLLLMVIINVIKYSGFNELTTMLNNAVIVFDIVPMALPLFVVVSYMVAAVRMANGGALLQRTNAVESLAHVDTICMDKTGTLTTNNLICKESTEYADNAEEIIKLYLGCTGSHNSTTKAIEDQFGKTECTAIDEIRFSSERKYSAVKTEYNGKIITIFMGADTAIGKYLDRDVQEDVLNMSKKGLRTVIISVGDDVALFEDGKYNIPALKAVAVLGLSDELRTNCRETLDVFYKNNMDIKVISGDNPATIDALFTTAKIPGTRNIISGEELDSLSGLAKKEAILRCNIFGRMRPEQKETIIETLKNSGRYVAMIGDGVNDVKSLKMANVGIAMQNGSSAARGASDILLTNNDFGALPKVLIEGRKTLAGMRDALKIFLTKNVIIAFLVFFLMILLASVLTHGATPFLPTQQMVYAFLAVTITSFLVIVWAQPDENKDSVLPCVMNYVLPTALTASLFGLIIYATLYLMISNGTIEIEMTLDYIAKYGLPKETIEELITDYTEGEILSRKAEIVARCGLVMFCIVEGIAQMFIVVPRWKFASLDGRINRDKRPFILTLVMFALAAVVYILATTGNRPLEGLFPMVSFPPFCIAVILLLVVVWFFANILLIKKGRLLFITRIFESWYQKVLAKEYESSNKEDLENNTDESMLEKVKAKWAYDTEFLGKVKSKLK